MFLVCARGRDTDALVGAVGGGANLVRNANTTFTRERSSGRQVIKIIKNPSWN